MLYKLSIDDGNKIIGEPLDGGPHIAFIDEKGHIIDYVGAGCVVNADVVDGLLVIHGKVKNGTE